MPPKSYAIFSRIHLRILKNMADGSYSQSQFRKSAKLPLRYSHIPQSLHKSEPHKIMWQEVRSHHTDLRNRHILRKRKFPHDPQSQASGKIPIKSAESQSRLSLNRNAAPWKTAHRDGQNVRSVPAKYVENTSHITGISKSFFPADNVSSRHPVHILL